MKRILLLVAFVQISCASNEWNQFKATYGKRYSSEAEENLRQKVFLERLKLVQEHQRKFEQGRTSYTADINKFSDRTREELYSSTKPHYVKTNYKIAPREDIEVPDSIDWRDYGVISPVLDQLFCETCWAFAVVDAVEAHTRIHKGVNVSLSQQNLADCVDPDFTCKTDMERDILERTYQYIVDNGIDSQESYPYEFYNVTQCRFNPDNVGAQITGYANVTEGDEDELKRVVGTIGPVTVAISVNYSFDLYRSGVYYEENCMAIEKNIFNHAVVIVGYGTENGEDYWLAKNSWSTVFGDQGYIKMARNRDNNCGIASIARYPLV